MRPMKAGGKIGDIFLLANISNFPAIWYLRKACTGYALSVISICYPCLVLFGTVIPTYSSLL